MINQLCPCGSGLEACECCEPYLAGKAVPPTAQALMRSRYSAYVLHNADYLRQSWSSATRPAVLDLNDAPVYLSLQIVDVCAGGEEDSEGWVEFKARFQTAEGEGVLHERSRFVRESGRWCYVDGTLPAVPVKVGRNAPCPCGSGKKYKHCCG